MADAQRVCVKSSFAVQAPGGQLVPPLLAPLPLLLLLLASLL